MFKKISITLLTLFWGTALLYGQAGDLPVEETTESVVKEKVVVKKPAAVAVVKPAVKKAVVKKKKEVKAPAPAEEKNTSGGRLLPINDGSFKYKRIPEIVIEEPQKGEDEEFVHIPDENLDESEKNEPDTGKKGFLGLKKETSDLVAWGFLVVLLIVIFLIYRARSGGSRSVHRSFPK